MMAQCGRLLVNFFTGSPSWACWITCRTFWGEGGEHKREAADVQGSTL